MDPYYEFDFDFPPLHITKLESPEGFQVWEREMREHLISVIIWKWTEKENSEAPTAEIPDLANDGSNELVRATALAALEEKVLAWKRGNELAYITILSRLGPYYICDYRYETNAHKIWNGIAKDCKPAGSVALNNLYQRLTTLSIRSCQDEADYTRRFKIIYNHILAISPALRLEANFLTFLFYYGLGKGDESHLPVDEGRMPWA